MTRVWRRVRQNLLVGTHGDNLAGLDCDSLVDGKGRVYRDDFAVVQNQVGIRGIEGAKRNQENNNARHDSLILRCAGPGAEHSA